MGDSPWGSYAGMFRDKYGIEWIIEFSPRDWSQLSSARVLRLDVQHDVFWASSFGRAFVVTVGD
jgi:hypothetical protein